MDENVPFERRNVYSNCRGLQFIYDKLGSKIGAKIGFGHSFWGIVIFFLIWCFIFTVATIVEGTLFMEGTNAIGWFEDRVWIASMFVFAFGFCLAKFFFDSFTTTFLSDDKIQKNIDWSKISKEDYEKKIENAFNFVDSKTWVIRITLPGINAFLLMGVYYQIYKLPIVDIWHLGTHWLGYAVWASFCFLMACYLLPNIVWRFVAILWVTNRIVDSMLKDNCITLNPLAADGLGGMKPIGNIILNAYYLLFTPLITVVVWFSCREINFMILSFLPGYTVFLIIMFFLPLVSIHWRMREIKEREIEKIGSEIFKYYEDQKNIQTKFLGNKKADLAIWLYERAEKMSTWPFDIKILSKIATTVSVPLLIVILEYYLM